MISEGILANSRILDERKKLKKRKGFILKFIVISMYELEVTDYEKVKPVFKSMDYHLALHAIIEGNVPAQVYVDDPDHPHAALTWVKHRFYLAGSVKNSEFNKNIKQFFADTLYPRALKNGEHMFVLYYDLSGWEDKINIILKDKYPVKVQRQFYTFGKLQYDWRTQLPQGYTVRLIDEALLGNTHLKNLDTLTEEMCSERPSVTDFLLKSFGICVIHNDEIIGWCLSEYNTGDRCEIGIETTEPYRRRGIATLTASALIEYCLSKGITHIGWHCYARNEPSTATALKVGFEKVRDYPVFCAWFNEVTNLAMNGYFCFENQNYSEALKWFENSLARGEAEPWVYWDAARAAAVLGNDKTAFSYLIQAVDKGSTNLELIRNSEYLTSLHHTREWKELIERLENMQSP